MDGALRDLPRGEDAPVRHAAGARSRVSPGGHHSAPGL